MNTRSVAGFVGGLGWAVLALLLASLAVLAVLFGSSSALGFAIPAAVALLQALGIFTRPRSRSIHALSVTLAGALAISAAVMTLSMTREVVPSAAGLSVTLLSSATAMASLASLTASGSASEPKP